MSAPRKRRRIEPDQDEDEMKPSIKKQVVNNKMQPITQLLAFKRNNLSDFSLNELEYIFTYIDLYDLVSIYNTTKQFEWISSSKKLSNYFFKYLSRNHSMHFIFSPPIFSALSIFNSTKFFMTYSRLASFNTSDNIYTLINPHQNYQQFKRRKLSQLTLNIFNAINLRYKSSINDDNTFLINNLFEFKHELNKRFKYNEWKDAINWKYFFLAGGSVLKCIMKQTFISKDSDHDIDLFAFGVNDVQFLYHLKRFKDIFKSRIIEIKYNKNDELAMSKYPGYVETIMVNFGDDKNPQIVTFQFIYSSNKQILTPSLILKNFDLDCCQIGFIGEYEEEKAKCLSTFAFLQSLATKTMICYKIENNIDGMRKVIERICKYSKRGFDTLLVPKQFNIELLKRSEFIDENSIKQMIQRYQPKGKLAEIKDSFQMKRQFINMLNQIFDNK